MTCFVFAKTLWGLGGHSGRPWSQLSGVCVLLHAWAGLGGYPGASCRGICVLLHEEEGGAGKTCIKSNNSNLKVGEKSEIFLIMF